MMVGKMRTSAIKMKVYDSINKLFPLISFDMVEKPAANINATIEKTRPIIMISKILLQFHRFILKVKNANNSIRIDEIYTSLLIKVTLKFNPSAK